MTLKEYHNQVNPKRMPNVVLMPEDYEEFHRLLTSTHDYSYVRINGLEGDYVIKNPDTRLWTTDQDGNPLKRSCFRITEL